MEVGHRDGTGADGGGGTSTIWSTGGMAAAAACGEATPLGGIAPSSHARTQHRDRQGLGDDGAALGLGTGRRSQPGCTGGTANGSADGSAGGVTPAVGVSGRKDPRVLPTSRFFSPAGGSGGGSGDGAAGAVTPATGRVGRVPFAADLALDLSTRKPVGASGAAAAAAAAAARAAAAATAAGGGGVDGGLGGVGGLLGHKRLEDMTDEEQLEYALQMSMLDQQEPAAQPGEVQPEAAAPAPAKLGAPPAATAAKAAAAATGGATGSAGGCNGGVGDGANATAGKSGGGHRVVLDLSDAVPGRAPPKPAHVKGDSSDSSGGGWVNGVGGKHHPLGSLHHEHHQHQPRDAGSGGGTGSAGAPDVDDGAAPVMFADGDDASPLEIQDESPSGAVARAKAGKAAAAGAAMGPALSEASGEGGGSAVDTGADDDNDHHHNHNSDKHAPAAGTGLKGGVVGGSGITRIKPGGRKAAGLLASKRRKKRGLLAGTGGGHEHTHAHGTHAGFGFFSGTGAANDGTTAQSPAAARAAADDSDRDAEIAGWGGGGAAGDEADTEAANDMELDPDMLEAIRLSKQTFEQEQRQRHTGTPLGGTAGGGGVGAAGGHGAEDAWQRVLATPDAVAAEVQAQGWGRAGGHSGAQAPPPSPPGRKAGRRAPVLVGNDCIQCVINWNNNDDDVLTDDQANDVEAGDGDVGAIPGQRGAAGDGDGCVPTLARAGSGTGPASGRHRSRNGASKVSEDFKFAFDNWRENNGGAAQPPAQDGVGKRAAPLGERALILVPEFATAPGAALSSGRAGGAAAGGAASAGQAGGAGDSGGGGGDAPVTRVDLTGGDDEEDPELAKALALSMETYTVRARKRAVCGRERLVCVMGTECGVSRE